MRLSFRVLDRSVKANVRIRIMDKDSGKEASIHLWAENIDILKVRECLVRALLEEEHEQNTHI